MKQFFEFFEFEFAISRQLGKFDRPSTYLLKAFDKYYAHMNQWLHSSLSVGGIAT